jgi:hypothetical protein
MPFEEGTGGGGMEDMVGGSGRFARILFFASTRMIPLTVGGGGRDVCKTRVCLFHGSSAETAVTMMLMRKRRVSS